MNEINLNTAITTLVSALHDDEYYESWKANIAMAYRDAEDNYKIKYNKEYLNKEDKHYIANQAADNFLKLLMNT